MINKTLAVFENFKIRRHYDEKADKWYFSIVDIIAVLTEQIDYKKNRNYWKWLKNKLKEEGSELVSNTNQLKMQSADGKYYKTDVADVQQLLRLIQSVPSPKAEPFKLWLAKVGYERIQETANPEMGLNRARANWKAHGRSDKWIQQRMTGQETRNKLTDYWQSHGVKESNEFAILTDIIHREWAGLTVKSHKALKGLKSQNLRDHMSEAELIFTALAELTTRQIAENVNAEGLHENKKAGKEGGKVAKTARLVYEERTGRKVITGNNFLPVADKNKLENK
ncbi:MAG: Bro-N domain-containing protein [Elusimicrobiota bacterium]|nr:Bro-N domain-containing protein [Elusimicrobiota bacterium]